jgi:hypothetical protein
MFYSQETCSATENTGRRRASSITLEHPGTSLATEVSLFGSLLFEHLVSCVKNKRGKMQVEPGARQICARHMHNINRIYVVERPIYASYAWLSCVFIGSSYIFIAPPLCSFRHH